jgi:hypothetical protein
MESGHAVPDARYECDFAFDFRAMADFRETISQAAVVADPATKNPTRGRR